ATRPGDRSGSVGVLWDRQGARRNAVGGKQPRRRVTIRRQSACGRREESLGMKIPKFQVLDKTASDETTGVARILVIDDEPIIRELLQEILGREGYRMSLVPDAESGLRALDDGAYDLIILDLMLPGIGGFETLQEIKRRDPDGVVVMITAYGSVESAVQAMRMGAYDYLTKPFKNEDVLRTLSTGLRHR